MKIRNGFVSNSSTSCFIVYGIKVESDDINITHLGGNIDIHTMRNCDDIYILGRSLGHFEYFENCKLDLDELIKTRDVLKKQYPDKDPELYVNITSD